MKDYEKIIISIYAKYEPAKIKNVHGLLEKYNGKEEEILEKLCDKYGIKKEDFIVEEQSNTKEVTGNSSNKKYFIIGGIALGVIILIVVVFFVGRSVYSKKNEEKRIADSTRSADSITKVVSKQKRISDSIAKVQLDQQIISDSIISLDGDDGGPDVILQTGEQPEKGEVLLTVEEAPKFPGGDAALYKWIGENLKYPEEAKELGIQGRVFLTFIIEPDGTTSNAVVKKGIGGGCDEESIRIIKAMPKWVPGKNKGVPVRVQFNLPLKFTLQ